jgi:CRP/FNR family transcriptional regulator
MQILRTDLDAKLVALRRCPYFIGLDDGILVYLAEGMRLARFERSEAVFWQDEACAGLHIVAHGSVKLFKLSPHGRELIVNIFKEGATFNEVAVFDGKMNPINVVALEESDLWIVDPQVIRAAMATHHEMCQAVVLNLANNLRMMVGILEEMSFYQVTQRLARLISQMTPAQLAGEATERVTQDQMAARLGTVREVVARSLRELERSGAIRLGQRRIYVVDKDILQEWAQRPG